MEEIKVGEYVRTYNGNIFKIIDGNSDNYDIDIDYYKLENTEEDWFENNKYNDNGYFFNEKHIKKHSQNIIDLIEVGDYVNGFRILEKTKIKDRNMHVCILKDNNMSNWITINSYTLKSIVTKEQFSSVEYRLEER